MSMYGGIDERLVLGLLKIWGGTFLPYEVTAKLVSEDRARTDSLLLNFVLRSCSTLFLRLPVDI